MVRDGRATVHSIITRQAKIHSVIVVGLLWANYLLIYSSVLQFQLFTKHVYKYCFPCRKVTITGFDLKSYRQCLQKWNAAITAMNEQCDQLGYKSI